MRAEGRVQCFAYVGDDKGKEQAYVIIIRKTRGTAHNRRTIRQVTSTR